MKCKLCRQESSPVYSITNKLGNVEPVTVLSWCAGYYYAGHHNIPERPYILFSVKSLGVLDNLWQKVFSRLSAPTHLEYNGSKQFQFEIDLPHNWPNRDKMLEEIWQEVDARMEKF